MRPADPPIAGVGGTPLGSKKRTPADTEGIKDQGHAQLLHQTGVHGRIPQRLGEGLRKSFKRLLGLDIRMIPRYRRPGRYDLFPKPGGKPVDRLLPGNRSNRTPGEVGKSQAQKLAKQTRRKHAFGRMQRLAGPANPKPSPSEEKTACWYAVCVCHPPSDPCNDSEPYVSEIREAAVELLGVTKALGGNPVVNGINLRIVRGEFFSLLGPSGCGKSTTMRLIAGFEKPDSGEILINGQATNGTPAYVRDINMVFQNYALFPHMSVRDNIGFGLEMMKVPEDERRRQVDDMLARVRMEAYGERLPRELSGGQQQRVAVARALVTRPSVVLLDEPLGALDLKLRKEMQGELRELQSSTGLTFIYVTHDQEEALTLSDRLAVMHKGRILQIGTPEEIYERPSTRFVADFIGQTNFLSGRLWVDEPERGQLVIDVDGARVRVNGSRGSLRPGDTVMALRPERIFLSRESPDADNRFEVKVEDVVYFGTARHYHVRLHNGVPLVVRQENRDAPALRKGEVGYVSWPSEAATIVQSEGP